MAEPSSRLLVAAPLAAVVALAAATLAPESAQSRIAVPSLGVVLLLATAAIVRFQARPEDRRFLTGLVFFAVAVRLVVLAFVHGTVGPLVFAPDQATYEIVAEQLLESWRGLRGPPPRVTDSIQVGYYYMNAALFAVFGRAPAAPAVLNTFLASWTAVPVYHLAKLICRGHRGVARWAAILTAFFPSLILWSVLNVREAPTILLITVAIFFAVHYQKTARPWDLAGLLIPLLLLALFREYLTLLIGFSAAAGIVIGKSRSPLASLAGGVTLLVATTFLLQGAGIGSSLAAEPSLGQIDFLRQDLARGAGSAFGTGADVSTLGGALTFLPIGLTYFLFAPFPWSVTSVLQAITLPESLLWYALVLFGVRGLWLAVRHDPRSYTVLLSVLLTVTFAYALVEGNVGTAYRHRAQILPLSFVVIAVGLQDFLGARSRRREELQRARSRAARARARAPGMLEPFSHR